MGEEVKKEKVKKEPKKGVGHTATQAILSGKTNEEAYAAVKAAHPEAKTTMASINWYRNKLRTDGNTSVKTSRELSAANKPAKEPKAKKAAKGADPLA